MVKVYAPNRAYTGRGAGGVMFVQGVGETDDAAALEYFRRHGYGIKGRPERGTPAPEQVFRPAEPATVAVGTPLRDAAVAPLDKDFLPPTNAGKADPHGPDVVAPGLHAVPPAPILPGPVAVDDPALQSAQETELAQAVLVDQVPVPDALEAIASGPVAPQRPAVRAPAGDWRDWAVAQGMDPVEAASTSKEKLIERYGG